MVIGAQKGGERMKRYILMMIHNTYDCVRTYVRDLIPRTEITHYTNPQCRRMISISKMWMGMEIKDLGTYELNEFDPEMVRWQKENIPRIQKNIHEYEEIQKATADKTEQNHI